MNKEHLTLLHAQFNSIKIQRRVATLIKLLLLVVFCGCLPKKASGQSFGPAQGIFYDGVIYFYTSQGYDPDSGTPWDIFGDLTIGSDMLVRRGDGVPVAYWNPGANMFYDPYTGEPSNMVSTLTNGVVNRPAAPQNAYVSLGGLLAPTFGLSGIGPSSGGGWYNDTAGYSNMTELTYHDWVQVQKYYNGGSWTGAISGSVGGVPFTGSYDPLTLSVWGVTNNVVFSFSPLSGDPVQLGGGTPPRQGPPYISWHGTLLSYSGTNPYGVDFYRDSLNQVQVWISNGTTVSGYSTTVGDLNGTYDASSNMFSVNSGDMFAMNDSGYLIGLQGGLTIDAGYSGFASSILLSSNQSSSVINATYTYQRLGGSWTSLYVGLPGSCPFLVVDNAGNYNSQLYITPGGDINAISGWPMSNAFPSSIYVNGVICPLHWDTNYVGGTGQSTYGGASYISADNSKTVTLNWAWNSGAEWTWSMNSQSGVWNYADGFSNLPAGVSIHLTPPPTAPSYGPPRLKLNGTELVFQGLASQDAGADVYIGGGRRLTIQTDGSVTVADESTGGVLLSGYYSASTHVVGFLGANYGMVIITMDASGNVLGVSQNASVAAGYRHNIAVRTDGTVWTWGANDYGQLGNGTNISSDVPVQVSGLSGVTAVAAGQGHTLALKNDGTVVAWGLNTYGQLGNNSTTASNAPVQVSGLSGVVAIAAGSMHSLAVKADGTVLSWGRNFEGQLGNNSTTDSHVPVLVSGLSNAISVAGGLHHSLAVKSDGTTWGWGNNGYGELGDGSTTSSTTPVPVTGMNNSWVSSAGADFSLGLKADGSVWAWGLGSTGQLGNNATVGSHSPLAVTDLNEVVAIAAGNSHSLAIRGDGSLWAWGKNDLGQLASDTGYNSLVPVQVVGVDDPVAVAAGQSHSLAISSNGAIFAWGDGYFGQLGNSTVDFSENPVQIVGLSSVTGISAGGQYSLAVTSDGVAWTWGAGSMGAAYATRLVPDPISGPWPDGVTAVASGYYHSLALSRDGHVWAWGANYGGQLGNNSTVNSGVPVQVANVANVTQIAAGCAHSVCLKSDGTVWAWGNNSEGELGNNSTTASHIPVLVQNLSGITAIAAQTGSYHTLALRDDGTVWAWGANWNGQLGNNTTDDSPVPVQVTGLTNVVAIATGYAHSLALKSDGTVWAWGYNSESELGNNSGVDSAIPVLVSGLTGVVKIGAGTYHSAVVKSDGSLWAWGWNLYGQLGNGTTTDSPTPVQVTGVLGVKALSCGELHTLALKEDGTVESWGYSVDGELGVGWGSTQVNPAVVLGLNLLHPAPQVAFTTPQPNTSDTVSMDQGINLQFSATLGDSVLSEIQVWSEGVYLGSAYSANSYWWQPPTWGDFVLTAVAVDQTGATSARSTPVAIHVPFDSDGDGIPDWWEIQHGLNPHNSSDAGLLSSDGTLTNLQKYLQSINPALADSDGDGIPDSIELAYGTNPIRKDAPVVGLHVVGYVAP